MRGRRRPPSGRWTGGRTDGRSRSDGATAYRVPTDQPTGSERRMTEQHPSSPSVAAAAAVAISGFLEELDGRRQDSGERRRLRKWRHMTCDATLGSRWPLDERGRARASSSLQFATSLFFLKCEMDVGLGGREREREREEGRRGRGGDGD